MWVLIVLAGARTIEAAEDPPFEAYKVQSIALTVEDDIPFSDNRYSFGTRFDYARSTVFSPTRTKAWGVSLSHYMYTPNDLSATPADPDDRPYAGWLCVSAYLEDFKTHDGLEVNRRVELQAGVVGPGAIADEVHSKFHSFIHCTNPTYSPQLPNEPTLMVTGTYLTGRGIDFLSLHNWRTRAYLHTEASVGTPFTNAGIGGRVLFGWNTPPSMGTRNRPSGIDPRMPSLLSDTVTPDSPIAIYWTFGALGRVVGYNEFLDGTIFSESEKRARRPFVLDTWTGITMDCHRVHVAILLNTRSPEMKHDNVHSYFTWKIGYSW